MDPTKHLYIVLNHVETHVITYGDPFECHERDVVVCITGNPGLPEFYIEFASEIYENLGFPVCIIGQAGHEEVKDFQSNVLKGQEHLFDLPGQIEHKLALIEKIEKSNTLHLIGHSIGSWMIVELLHKHKKVNNSVSTVNLLFPTVQKMADTKNGLFLNNILRRIHFLVILFFTVVHSLPITVKQFLIDLYLKLYGLPFHLSDRIVKYLNPKVGEKVLFLAYKEMDEVVSINVDGFAQIKDKTNVIYSSCDDWAPVKYFDSLLQFKPELSSQLVHYDHTFVIKDSIPVANIVTHFIKKHLAKKIAIVGSV